MPLCIAAFPIEQQEDTAQEDRRHCQKPGQRVRPVTLSLIHICIVSGSNAGPLLAQKLYDLGIITDKVVSNTDTATVYEGAGVVKAAKYSDLDTALETGAVDAVCMDKCIAGTYMNESREFLDVDVYKRQVRSHLSKAYVRSQGSDIQRP